MWGLKIESQTINRTSFPQFWAFLHRFPQVIHSFQDKQGKGIPLHTPRYGGINEFAQAQELLLP
jgi:hypothetical protein